MTMPKLRVLCPTYWYPEHSTDIHATYVHDINRHLVSLGHEVTVVTPGNPGLADEEEFDGVRVIRFPMELPEDLTYGKVAQSKVGAIARAKRIATMAGYTFKQALAGIRAGRKFSPDIVHGHWAIPTGPAVIACARYLRVPAVITMHGGDVYVNEEQGYNFPKRWYVRPILRRTLRAADALTAISEDCREHALSAGAPAGNIELIMNGADLRRFTPLEPDGPGSEQREDTIFACRQLFPRKGVRFLLKAFSGLCGDFPRASLIIAGDGIERPVLVQLAAELGIADRVRFLGWVPNAELPQYYRAAKFSVIPSLEEGFGIPAAEAMGCGIPVIASDAGGLPEVVEHGETGLIVPKGDVPALESAMRTLLGDDDLCKRMGAKGRERALSCFDWLLTARSMERIYQRLLEGKARE